MGCSVQALAETALVQGQLDRIGLPILVIPYRNTYYNVRYMKCGIYFNTRLIFLGGGGEDPLSIISDVSTMVTGCAPLEWSVMTAELWPVVGTQWIELGCFDQQQCKC